MGGKQEVAKTRPIPLVCRFIVKTTVKKVKLGLAAAILLQTRILSLITIYNKILDSNEAVGSNKELDKNFYHRY